MFLLFSPMSCRAVRRCARRCADFSHITHSGVGKAGGSDLHLTHDLPAVNRSDPVIILSPPGSVACTHLSSPCACLRACLWFSHSRPRFGWKGWPRWFHTWWYKKKVFSGLAAKRMEHNECLIWQVAAFLISTMWSAACASALSFMWMFERRRVPAS